MLLLQNKEEQHRYEIANNYHLAIGKRSLDLLGVIDKTNLWFLEYNRDFRLKNAANKNEMLLSPINVELSQRDNINALQQKIGQVAVKIKTIQKTFSDKDFNLVAESFEKERIKTQKNLSILKSSVTKDYRVKSNLAVSLRVVTHQLHRLHNIAYKELQIKKKEFTQRRNVQIISVISILTLLALFGVYKMLRHVWSALSELEVTQDELEIKELKLRELHTHVPGIIYQFEIDRAGKRHIPYVSPTLEKYLGISAESVMSDAEKWFSITHPLDIKGLESSIEKSMFTMSDWEWEGRFIHNKKGALWFKGMSVPVKQSDGSVLWDGVFIDITKQKTLEQELEDYRNSLESQIEVRTSELVKAKDEAERANDAKSEFLSSMSHELRTPLNAILGFGQMLELNGSELTTVQKSNVKEILDAGNHLLNLINDVLNLAKIEAGKTEISMEKVDVTKILHECIKLMSSSIDKMKLKVIDNISEHRYFVYADYMRLKQIFLNLMSNAVKYNQQSGRIIFDSRVNSQRIRLCITDTGKGLTKDEVNRLFNPFERLNVEENIEGTGIGLTITKHLSELMGGSIGVESTPNKGSTFWLEFELANHTTKVSHNG